MLFLIRERKSFYVLCQGDNMTSSLLFDIGNRLKERRLELRLTQRKIADILEVSLNFYGEIERGTKRISLEKIVLAHERLGLDPTYLLTGIKPSSINLNRLLLECPQEKRFDFEQLIKYASNLYK